MRRLPALALICATVLIVVSGCADAGQDPATRGSAGLRSRDMTGGLTAPSLTKVGKTGATAVGTVVYRRDQGGFFGIADLVPGDEPDPSASIIAILVQSDGGREGADLGPLVGAYCAFTGTLREEAATSTPAPELIVESYRILNIP